MFTLPPLPYDLNALAPAISAQTLELHYGAHHAAYVRKTNALVKQQGLEGAPLEDVVRTARETGEGGLFNQAAQAWNHGFLWNSLTPSVGRRPTPDGALQQAIHVAFGGADAFARKFVEQGTAHFASGWIWLVAARDGAVRLVTTHDADTPIAQAELQPLAVCDLWEHAYYLDYQNERGVFLQGFVDRLINWDFAESQYAAAIKGAGAWRYPG